MLRMFKRPTLKLWGVSPKLIFPSDKYLLKLLLTAVPKKALLAYCSAPIGSPKEVPVSQMNVQ